MARAERKQSYGVCELCGQRSNKAGMSRHLAKCSDAKLHKAGGVKSCWRISISGSQPFWIEVLVRGNAKLADLDAWLRELWLECCGHMSMFRIGESRYVLPLIKEDMIDMGDKSMDVTLDEVLTKGLTFTHEYDFGTTTGLDLKAVGQHKAALGRDKIKLLTRNEDPEWKCIRCDKPASWICTHCMWESDSPFYCEQHEEHADEHDEMLLPVVNSPRMGQCGYEG